MATEPHQWAMNVLPNMALSGTARHEVTYLLPSSLVRWGINRTNKEISVWNWKSRAENSLEDYAIAFLFSSGLTMNAIMS